MKKRHKRVIELTTCIRFDVWNSFEIVIWQCCCWLFPCGNVAAGERANAHTQGRCCSILFGDGIFDPVDMIQIFVIWLRYSIFTNSLMISGATKSEILNKRVFILKQPKLAAGYGYLGSSGRFNAMAHQQNDRATERLKWIWTTDGAVMRHFTMFG